jgi:hypothetical protein
MKNTDIANQVGEERQHLAAEQLAAAQRAGEHGLQRPVGLLAGDDVAGDQGDDDRRTDDGDQLEDDEREPDAGVAEVIGQRRLRRSLGELEQQVDDRADGRGCHPQPRPALGGKLEQLPAKGNEPSADHVDTCSATGGRSVSSKNTRSSVSCSGTRARMTMPASLSAWISASRSASSPTAKRTWSGDQRPPR